METFLRPKAPAHAPASHVAWLIALAATPREGHSRSSLVGSWVGLLADSIDRRWDEPHLRLVKKQEELN